MYLTERHTFKTSENQKQTLKVLKDKYKINTSKFIRDAIKEKLEREKESMFKNFKEAQIYLYDNCPF